MESERRKYEAAFTLAVLFATMVFVSVGCASAETIYVPDNFLKIQYAVNNATANDIIIVRDGTYNENVDVNVNNLTIQSENGSDSTIVQAANSNDHVFAVTADYVNISGFTVEGATGEISAGIYLDADHCTISDNNASNNNNNGISLTASNNNTLQSNTANLNYFGIRLFESSDNTLTGNTANSNSWNGISLSDGSSENTLVNNAVSKNIKDGIYLSWSSNNNITNNKVSNNRDGIYIYACSNNEIEGNIIVSNSGKGIWIDLSQMSYNNIIYNNYFEWNGDNAISDETTGATYFNISKTPDTNIIGGPYIGGNYWDDYEGEDTDDDGIGEDPYPINPMEWDYLPLVPLKVLPIHNLNTSENFSTIQAAIYDNDTENGHIIEVDPGTYNENVKVNKSLTICSTSGNPADTIVNASNLDDRVLNVTADSVNISGFTVTGATGWNKVGIYLGSVKHCNISNINASNNWGGIYLDYSSYNTLANNTANSNRDGVVLEYSSYNNLMNNEASKNDGPGINLVSSNYNTLAYNDVNGNWYHGIWLQESSNYNELKGNSVLRNGLEIGNGIYLQSSNHNTITENTASETRFYSGISFEYSSNNTLQSNIALDNYIGIYLSSSSNNNLASNNITNNYNYGVLLALNTSGNVINFNNIEGNPYGVYNENITEIVNAENNWWGDVSGPSDVGNGTGDAVSAYVDYDPWLNASYPRGGPINFTNATTVTTGTGTTEIDAREVADTNVTINTTAPVNVTIGNYSRNPKASLEGNIGKYIDVHIDNITNVKWIKIKLYYTDAEIQELNESSLKLSWWNGSAWVNCSYGGVNTDAVDGYSGYIWANISNGTTPSLSELSGLPLAARGAFKRPPPLAPRVRHGGKRVVPIPLPTLTPTPTPMPTLPLTPTPMPTLTPTPSPSPTPSPPTDEGVPRIGWVIIIVALVAAVIIVSVLYLIPRRRGKQKM